MFSFIVVDNLVYDSLQVRVVSSEGDLTVKVKLHSLKIKDELQGSLSSRPQYLACSLLTNEHSSSSRGTSNPHGEELSVVTTEEDDIFKDALPDFMSLPDSAEDLGKGRSMSGDVFYEAQDSDYTDFVSLSYLARAPGSPDYDGIDTQVT